MKKNITTILSELYELDESLRQHEEELIKVIAAFEKARPDPVIDKRFVKELRTQLLARATEDRQRFINTNNFNFMNKLAFGIGGAALALIIAIPLLTKDKTQSLPGVTDSPWNASAEITPVSDGAFGVLSDTETAEQATGLGSANPVAPMAESLPSAETMEIKGFGGGGGMMVDSRIALPPVEYTYVYTGEPLSLAENQVSVLRKTKGNAAAADLARRFGNINFGVVDLGTFSNQIINNISFLEDKEYGYMINADLLEGTISINQNWQRWPQPDYTNRIDISDIPADETIIAKADEFLRAHNISTSQYADPLVQNDWRKGYEQAQDKANYYIPEIAQVIYPLVIDDQIVYDQGGRETGLMVSVNLLYDKVVYVTGLTSQQYQSSQYTAVTDSQRILDLVAQGGLYPRWYYNNEAAEVQELEIGTPRQVLTRFYHYTNNESQELLAPALLFPILNPPAEGYWYETSIIIPLVEDLIPKNIDRPDVGIPEPMPLEALPMAR